MCIGVAVSIGSLAEPKDPKCIRQAIRLLRPSLRHIIYHNDYKSQDIQHFIRNNMLLLLWDLKTQAALDIGVHGRSKVWYTGKTAKDSM